MKIDSQQHWIELHMTGCICHGNSIIISLVVQFLTQGKRHTENLHHVHFDTVSVSSEHLYNVCTHANICINNQLSTVIQIVTVMCEPIMTIRLLDIH